ncbi:MAG: hypothetical protein HYZ54_12045 [Ignavibacteriae bacterium]|nr:hypothetical protein [Ignavibacteriota bacterium]
MKLTRLALNIFTLCLLTLSLNSCRKVDDLNGPTDVQVGPADPFIVAPVADDGEGVNCFNGNSKQPWEIDGQQYTSTSGIKIDTSNNEHHIWVNGQFFPKIGLNNQLNKKELNVLLQSINFKFDSLALGDVDQVITPEQKSSKVSFTIKKSILRALNNGTTERIRDFDTVTIAPNRQGPVRGVVFAKFYHLKNNDPIIPYRYSRIKRYQGVLEIWFAINVDVDVEHDKIIVKDTKLIEGSVRLYFNYGNTLL